MSNDEKKVGIIFALTVTKCNVSANVTKSVRVVFTFLHFSIMDQVKFLNQKICLSQCLATFAFSLGYVVSAFTMLDKKWICKKTRPDTAKLLAFLKSAAKTASETSNSLQTSKILQNSVSVNILSIFCNLRTSGYSRVGQTTVPRDHFMRPASTSRNINSFRESRRRPFF